MKDYKLEDCIKKLEEIYLHTERAKMIYMWVKQNHITLSQFKELIEYC